MRMVSAKVRYNPKLEKMSQLSVTPRASRQAKTCRCEDDRQRDLLYDKLLSVSSSTILAL